MSMNIYIKPHLERRLRDYGGSMSGLINELLESHFNKNLTKAEIEDKFHQQFPSSPEDVRYEEFQG